MLVGGDNSFTSVYEGMHEWLAIRILNKVEQSEPEFPFKKSVTCHCHLFTSTY